ncbi:hypothetical protein MHBO_004156 [Bonamia ostreae]|uniref:Uncharacterized protein n=1 Tax=Bonamia ostreae TaxID=126728 RepID=A0ABV2ASK4_9EUKA
MVRFVDPEHLVADHLSCRTICRRQLFVPHVSSPCDRTCREDGHKWSSIFRPHPSTNDLHPNPQP